MQAGSRPSPGSPGGADQILVPEVPFDLDEVCDSLRGRFNRGKKFSIVVVAEGARPKEMKEAVTASERVDEFGHEQLGGIGQLPGRELERRLGVETRVTVLGHVQRGGSPTAHDRVLASRFGVRAIEQIAGGNFGVMVAQHGDRIEPVPLADVCRLKTVDMDLFDMAKIFF
jgi:6-phosphofructokinase